MQAVLRRHKPFLFWPVDRLGSDSFLKLFEQANQGSIAQGTGSYRVTAHIGLEWPIIAG